MGACLDAQQSANVLGKRAGAVRIAAMRGLRALSGLLADGAIPARAGQPSLGRRDARGHGAWSACGGANRQCGRGDIVTGGTRRAHAQGSAAAAASGRIGWRTARRIVDGRGEQCTDERLRALIAAAAAPAVGRWADPSRLGPLLAAFREAADMAATGEGGVAVPVRSTGRERRLRVMPRSLAVRCAAVVLVVCAGAVAAAAANTLPAPVQRIAHEVLGGIGVPTPAGSGGGVHTGAQPTGTSRPAIASATPAPPSATFTSAAATAAALPAALKALCGQVDDRAADWQSAVSAADRSTLISAAGGEQDVVAYCSNLLKTTGGATRAPTKATTAPSGARRPTTAPAVTHPAPHPSRTASPHPNSTGN